MDKTVEIVMVVMVALATAAILLFMIQGRSGSFTNFLDSEASSGKCQLWEAQYERTGDESIRTKAQTEGCSDTGTWTYSGD